MAASLTLRLHDKGRRGKLVRVEGREERVVVRSCTQL